MKLKFITFGSATVLIVTIFNRGTGYLRDLTMTAALGASPASQIFVFAFRVFGLVRGLTSEAAIPAIVVDRYVRQRLGAELTDGPAFLKAEWGSWWLLWALWAVLLAVVNPFLMALMLPSDIYARLSSGFILFFSLLLGIGLSTTSVSAVYPSLFQAQGRFFAHSALASVQNIVFIGIFVIVLLLKIDDLQLLSLQVAVALLIAGSLQIMISCLMISHPFAAVVWPFRFPRPRRFHLRLAFDTLTKMVPISMFNVTSPLAAILATLILVRDDLNITYFFVAERLVQLVPGTVGYAVGIVILPLTARARHNKSGDLFQMIILISTLLPAGASIAVLLHQFSMPIINLLYQHLNFTEADALTTSVYVSSIAISVLPLIVEPMLMNRLFAQMRSSANVVLLTGSILICIVVWLLREPLGALLGGSHGSEACAVFVFIIAARVVLLMILNIAVSGNLGLKFVGLNRRLAFFVKMFGP
jgi:putative peptidoglycan lipid II flippase